jgi:hypothetical protein
MEKEQMMFEVGKFYKDKWGDKAVCNYSSQDLCIFTCTMSHDRIKTDCDGYSHTSGQLLIVEPWGDLPAIDPKFFAERLVARIMSIIEEEVAKHGGGK